MTVPARVGVLGGGRMGAGIAHGFCVAGSEVMLVDISEEAASAGRERIVTSLHRSVANGTASEPIGVLEARISTGVDIAGFADCDLVVEAVPEDFDLKVRALIDVEQHLADGAWLASNTSSLSIGALAAGLNDPARFCGLHFFNPVPASELVEVVVGAATGASTRELAVACVEYLGKTPVVVTDSPGFASSRLGVVLALEAMRMVEEGVATPEDIDAAMVLGYRHQTGPLRTTDLVGLDVRLAIAEYLESRLGDRFAPPSILREKVERGEIGRKSGQGFFEWP